MTIIEIPEYQEALERHETPLDNIVSRWEPVNSRSYKNHFRNDLRALIDYIIQIAQVQHLCLWTQDEEGNWDTACGHTFTLLDETSPKGNDMSYCPFCSGSLVEEFYSDPIGE